MLHDVKVDDPLRHFDSHLAERLCQYRRHLPVSRAAGRTEKLKFELDAVLVANAVTVVIFPAGFVEELGRPFRVVRPWFDIGIEIFYSRIKGRNANRSKAQADGVDHLLPVNEHRHGLAHAFVSEDRPFVIP